MEKYHIYLKRIYLFVLVVLAIRVLNYGFCIFLQSGTLEWIGLYAFLTIPLFLFIVLGGILLMFSKKKNRLLRVCVSILYLAMGLALAYFSPLFHELTLLGILQEMIFPNATAFTLPMLGVGIFTLIFLSFWFPTFFKAFQDEKL